MKSRDERLLDALAELESIAQNDAVVRELFLHVAKMLAHQSSAYPPISPPMFSQNMQRPTDNPLISPVPHASTDVVPLPTSPMQPPMHPGEVAASQTHTNHEATLPHDPAHNPLTWQILSFLPYEYQTVIGRALSVGTTNKKALIGTIAAGLAFGMYSGQIPIPAFVKAYLTAPQPQTQTQTQTPQTPALPTH